MKCQLCGRKDYDRDNIPEYLHLKLKEPKPDWSSNVCVWCWKDFESSYCYKRSQDEFNRFLSIEMLALAKRSAQKKCIYRCEAVTVHQREWDEVFSHRCQHYAKTQDDEGHWICGVHADRLRRGLRSVFVAPSAPRWYIAAESPDEFLFEMRRLLPADWLAAISRNITQPAASDSPVKDRGI